MSDRNYESPVYRLGDWVRCWHSEIFDEIENPNQKLYFKGRLLRWRPRICNLTLTCDKDPEQVRKNGYSEEYQVDWQRKDLYEWVEHLSHKDWGTNRVLADLPLAWLFLDYVVKDHLLTYKEGEGYSLKSGNDKLVIEDVYNNNFRACSL